MEFTRIPRPLSSLAQVRAYARTAAFDAPYAPMPTAPLSPELELVRITEAPWLRSGRAFCTVRTVPLTLMSKSLSWTSSVSSSTVASSLTPALATTTSRPCPRAATCP